MDEPKRILLIDDDTGYLEEMKALLEENGYSTRPCMHITHSLAEIRDFRPDCILLDVRMPLFQGDVFLPWIRRQSPEIPIVLATAVSELDLEFFLRHGVREILYKPFGHERLFDVIRRVIAQSGSFHAA